MILNETPVRTSKNFNSNNIELKNFEVPQENNGFLNRNIYINSEKKIMIVAESQEDSERLNDLYEDNKVLVTEITKSDFKLKYGVGQENNPNQFIRVLAKEGATGVAINLEFTFDEENTNLQDAIEIYAEKDTDLDVTISYVPNEEFGEYSYHNGVIKLTALENANVNITVVNLLNNSSDNLISFENKLLDNAKLNYTIIDFGGKNSITNYYTDLFGKNSDNRVNSIYLGNNNQLFDLNYIAHCHGEKSNINIEVQGALKDEAIKHFKGTIDFKKGCKKAVGNENENCLLLSDKAKSLALPMLLCSEEDVEGNHSSSSGKAGQKELFYLMSRGLTEKDAMKLLVRAKFNTILEGITKNDVKELVSNAIDSKL
ncbi:MAG: SufD family Fe-S cluster assembly protein [Clostridia bacterium]|nr:SufD family Fe-S cluster assembly protein [Clostridia bacterium]